MADGGRGDRKATGGNRCTTITALSYPSFPWSSSHPCNAPDATVTRFLFLFCFSFLIHVSIGFLCYVGNTAAPFGNLHEIRPIFYHLLAPSVILIYLCLSFLSIFLSPSFYFFILSFLSQAQLAISISEVYVGVSAVIRQLNNFPQMDERRRQKE